MRLKLTYLDIASQQSEIVVNTPIAIGCDLDALPAQIEGQNVAQVLVYDAAINPYHALIVERQGRIVITNLESDRPIGVSKDHFTVGQIVFTFEVLPELVSSSSNGCQKMVGFLFKRPCDRTSRVGCPHCNDFDDDYESDYVYYENYGSYDTWGYTYYRDRHYYYYDCDQRRVEFTEADNVAFESEGNQDFEQDYSAS